MREHALRGIRIAGGALRDHRMVGGDDDDDQEQAEQRGRYACASEYPELAKHETLAGKRRPAHRWPVAAAIAFATAGAITGRRFPNPVGRIVDGTIWTSIAAGASRCRISR